MVVNKADAATAVGHVRAVERALDLLFILAEHPGGASLHRLAQEARCSKSTVHRLLATLEGRGMVEQDRASRHYRLGTRVRRLCDAARPGYLDIRAVARPLMLELRDHSGETVTLHVPDGSEHVVVEKCESREEIRRVMEIGQRIPLAQGATGKALLAYLAPDQGEQLTQRLGKDRTPLLTPAERDEVRAQGYTMSLGERLAGGRSVSAPVLDHDGQAHAALSISGPDFRFTEARALACVPALVRATRRIADAMGWDTLRND